MSLAFEKAKEPIMVELRVGNGPWVTVEVDSTMTGEDFAAAIDKATAELEHPALDPTLFGGVPTKRKETRGPRKRRRPPGAP